MLRYWGGLLGGWSLEGIIGVDAVLMVAQSHHDGFHH
jgi:hypothetical protein